MIYNQLKQDIRDILKQLCSYKEVEIIEGHIMPDPYTHACKYPTENECIEFYGIFKRKIRIDDI